MPPGKTAEQVEHWSLHRNVKLTDLTDDALDAAILPLLRAGAETN
jgi:3-methyladenine DNA glycosylase AlkC